MTNINNKRILITGATGFLGSNLTRRILELGGKVTALTRPSSNMVRIEELLPQLDLQFVDLNDEEILHSIIDRIKPHIIFNLAAAAGHPATREARLKQLNTSVIGTANLLEALSSTDFEQFIHFGSSTEYGSKDFALKETLRLDPNTFRGVAKAAATLLCRQFALSHNRSVVIIRPFSVYGYWEAPTRLIPTAIQAALQGSDLKLTNPGYVRDPIFVEDLVEAGILALNLQNCDGQIINIGSGQQWSNEAIIEQIEVATGQKIKLRIGEYPPSPSDTHHWVADISKARELIGWQPKHSFQAGLGKTVAWFRPKLALYESWKLSSSQQRMR